MERAALGRRVLAELAKPRYAGRFGPSSWDLRARLQDEGVTVSAADLLSLLAWLRDQGWLRYQSAPGASPSAPVGNVRITEAGRAWLAAPEAAGD